MPKQQIAKMNSSFCLAALLICSSVVASTSLTPTPSTKQCLSSWKQFQHKCYRFIPGDKTVMEAEEICQGFGSHLTSIHSEEENEFLYNFANENVKHGWLLLGAITHDMNRFYWLDGTRFDFDNWEPGFPKNRLNYTVTALNLYSPNLARNSKMWENSDKDLCTWPSICSYYLD